MDLCHHLQSNDHFSQNGPDPRCVTLRFDVKTPHSDELEAPSSLVATIEAKASSL